MKKYKLTPFEKLQVEKERLREERETAEKRMLFQFRYIADNWGMIITKSITGGVKNKLSETIDNISYAGTNRTTIFHTSPRKMKWGNFLISNLPTIAQIDMAHCQACLDYLLYKKVMSMILKRQKKNKNSPCMH